MRFACVVAFNPGWLGAASFAQSARLSQGSASKP